MSTVSTSAASGVLIAPSVDPPRSGADEPRSEADLRARRRRWMLWGISVLAVLTVLRLVAPSIIASWIAARVSTALGVTAQVDDVDLGLLTGKITVKGIHAAPPADASASSIAIETLTVAWKWRDLVRGIARVDALVSGIDVVVDFHRPWPAERDTTRSRSSMLRSLAIDGGSVLVVMDAQTPPIFALTELRGSMSTSEGLPTQTMTTQLSVNAKANESGSLALDGAISPDSSTPGWTVRFGFEGIDLRPFNPLFQRIFEMDVERGSLSLTGGLTSGFGRVRGRLHPRFDDLEVLGAGETDARHPMAEALLSAMVSGADLPVDIDQEVSSSEGTVSEAMARIDPKELLTQIVLRGFIRRLDTLDGYDPTVARAELDFPAGRMSFFDITMTRIGGAVGYPFVYIARMDIVIEQSAVDSGVLAYKSLTLHEPSLIFVTGETPAKSQTMFDPDWQAKVNVLPYPTDRVEIFDGRVEYRDDTTDPPTSLVISDLDLSADNIGRAKVGDGRRGATLVGRGRVMELGALALEIQFSPGVVDLDAAMKLRLEPLPLRDLNGLIEGRLGIDVSSGTLALAADLDAYAGHLKGTVTPALREVRVLGVDELHVIHPVRELMLERRLRKLDGTTLTLDRRVRTSVIRELPAALMSAARQAE